MPDFLYLSDLQSSFVDLLLVAGVAVMLPLYFDKNKTWHRSAIFAVAGLLALRYLWWRATQTIAPLDWTLDCAASWSLLAFEGIAIVSSLSSFVIMSRTCDRSAEASANHGWWAPDPLPRVVIMIATYNEDKEVLERTIIGAKALNHKALEVLVLDDKRRDWLRDYCETQGVRYLRRPDNRDAKAGNINHALQVLAADPQPPDFIAVLDADFVPHRGFISRSLALFHDPSVGLVQTPQHFFNADPVQHNLGLSRSYPDEQRFFFDHLQPARDAWGTAFCCGTSSLIRWAAVMDVGGFPTDSITEDFMLTLVLQDKGWRTVYLNEALTEGLAPEGLKEYVTQRARWCLGLMQIARGRMGPLSRNNLRFRDRWSVMDAVFYWLSTFPFRLVALTYPLLYWFLNLTVVNAGVADVIRFFGVYYFWVLLAMNSVARGMVVPVVNDVSQILGAIQISRAAIVGLIQPHGHPFSVTAKGGDRSRIIVQWRLLQPYLIMLVLTFLGLLIGIFSDRFAFNDAGGGKAVILFWTVYNLIVLGITMIAFVELPRHERHVADKPERGIFSTSQGLKRVWLTSLTQDTLRIRGQKYPIGEVGIIRLPEVGDVTATVIDTTDDGARLRLQATDTQYEALMLRFYAEGDHPGVVTVRLAALVRDAARRLSFSE
jgi:cellulose synthase (UDP-forming)